MKIVKIVLSIVAVLGILGSCIGFVKYRRNEE